MTSFFPSKHSFITPLIKLLALIALPLVLNSCAMHESNRQLAPGASESRINGLKSFYVRKHSDDNYKLGEDIAAELQSMGYKATFGTAQTPPAKVDAVISFMDRWTWDITMYMLSLDLQIREPGSDAVFATAKTVRTSLIRKSQKEMVRETLNKLLTKQ
jgi:hypothetical protein